MNGERQTHDRRNTSVVSPTFIGIRPALHPSSIHNELHRRDTSRSRDTMSVGGSVEASSSSNVSRSSIVESTKHDRIPDSGELPVNANEHPTADVIGPQQHVTAAENEPSDLERGDPQQEATDAKLDEQAMNAADEAGSAFLPHDKVLASRKDDRPA